MVSFNLCAFCVKDLVMLQSAFRGHVSRESQLQDLLEQLHNEVSATQTPPEWKKNVDTAIIAAVEKYFLSLGPHPSPHFLLAGCRSHKPQHSGRGAGCGCPDTHPIGFPGSPGSLHN